MKEQRRFASRARRASLPLCDFVAKTKLCHPAARRLR